MSEQLARRFHETYERLAPQFGYKTRKETREFDPRSPNGKLMIAVCAEIEAAKDAEIGRLRKLVKSAYVEGWGDPWPGDEPEERSDEVTQ